MAIKSFHQKRKFFAHPIKLSRNQAQLLKDFAAVCNQELRIEKPIRLICFQPSRKRGHGAIRVSKDTLGITTPSDTVWIRADLPLEEMLGVLAHELAHIRELEKNGSKKTTPEQDRKMERIAMDYELSWRSAFSGGSRVIMPKRNTYKCPSKKLRSGVLT